VVLPKPDQMKAAPCQAKEVGIEVHSLVDVDDPPPGVLHNVLTAHQRDNECRVEINPARVSTCDVMKFIGDTANKHASVISGLHYAARPFR
jgi:hypothetical protein